MVIDSKSCTDAAVGIERSTKALRPPDQEIIAPLRARCVEDGWPNAAIECFATMKEREDELAACALQLPVDQRENLVAALVGNASDDTEELAAIVGKLQTLQVGILNCDRFVQAGARHCHRHGLD